MRVALYARVSTIDKDQNPETQMRLLREHAARLGWEVAGEYVDTVSAVDYAHRIVGRPPRRLKSPVVEVDRAARRGMPMKPAHEEGHPRILCPQPEPWHRRTTVAPLMSTGGRRDATVVIWGVG